jgi:hypothetical protein
MPALERIRALYPDPPPAAPDARDRARLALVARIEDRPRRRFSRQLALPAAGLAAAAAAALITLTGVGDEAAIDAQAAAALRQAAERTRAQPEPAVGVGIYTKSITAYMATWADRGIFSVLGPKGA